MSAQPHPAVNARVVPADPFVVRQDDDERTSDLDFDEPTLQFDEPAAAPIAAAVGPPAPAPVQRSPMLTVAPGTVLRERYLLQQVVGTGGTSMVYRAQDLRHEVGDASTRVIAVKLLHEELREDARAIERLKREFAQMQLLAHPSVLKVFDVDVDKGVWFMTMELLEGQSLSMYLRTHRDAHPQALEIIKACGEALQFAHDRGIVHGDLKPGNIFLTSGGVRVLDFIGAGDDSRSDRAATPAYASPQRLAGELPEVSDDIYSLGCVAYELLSGLHPFDRKPAAVAHELGLQPARISSLSYRQWRALDRALAFDRRDRPASMRAFLDALLHQDTAPDVSRASAAPQLSTDEPSGIISVAVPSTVLNLPPEGAVSPASTEVPTSASSGQPSSGSQEVPAAEPPLRWRDREALLEPMPELSGSGARELPPVFEPPRRRGMAPAIVVLLIAALAIIFAQSDLTSDRAAAESSEIRSENGAAPTPTAAAALPVALPAHTEEGGSPSTESSDNSAAEAPAEPTTERPRAGASENKSRATARTPASPGVSFTTSRVSVSERSVAAVLQVKRLGSSTAGRIPVRWQTEKRSAKPGEDYTEASGTLILQDGQRVGVIYVPIKDDDEPESDEMFVVELLDTEKNAARDIGMAIVTIRDDDRTLLVANH